MLLKRHTVDQKEGSACCVLSTEAIFGRKYESLLKKMDLVIDDCEIHRLRLWFVDWREGRLGWCLVQSSFTLSYIERNRSDVAVLGTDTAWPLLLLVHIINGFVEYVFDDSLSEGHMTLQVCPRVI